MPTPTILIPLDGSKLAEASLLYLPALVPLGSFDVELIHVDDPEAAHEAGGLTWDEYLDFQPFARRYLREALSE